MKTKVVGILVGIFLFGVLLRFWQLGQVPVILNRDEAALAYNALLLQQTGKDEWSQRWPLALESFGDYKLIGYPVVTILSFLLFGYSDWSVKFPSAVAGCALIILGYWWIKRLTRLGDKEALFFSFLIAIQPVFFFYSRIAFEANVALALFVWSVLIYFRARVNAENNAQRWTKDLLASALVLGAVFTYNTPLLLLPFLIPVLIWWRGFGQWKKWLPALAGILLVLVMGGLALLTLSKQKSGITIFSDENVWLESVQYHQQFSGWEQKIFGNKAVFYAQIIGQHYLQSVGPVFLVERGGANPWQSLPGWGHIYWTTYILGLIGILGAVLTILNALKQHTSVSKNFDLKLKILLLYLLLTSLLPAAVTVDAPHATRSLFFFFVWLIFSVLGLRTLEHICQSMLKPQPIKKSNLKGAILLVVIILEVAEGSNYFYHYFRDYPAESNAILRGHFAPVVQQVTQDPSVTKAAIIDDGGYQYILVAWYLKMPPAMFFATVQKQLPDRIGFRYGYELGKFRFIKQPADHFPDEKTLIEWDSSRGSWVRKDL